jgi:TPR repeat protein
MKILTTIFFLTSAMLLLSVGKSFALPSCPSNPNAYYDNCIGVATYANGDKYVGEWRDGKRDVYGSYTYANGNKHVGEYKDSKANGQGTYTYANGNKYVGKFKDDKKNGQGTFTYANGGKYVGKFKDDKYNGQGTYIFSNGDQYVGEFKDDKANGKGTLTYGNGNQYVGTYKGKKNRKGAYADGRVEKEFSKNSGSQYVQTIPPIVTAKKFSKPFSRGRHQKKLAVESGDFSAALRKWHYLAEQGNADAQSNVGWIYQYVQGAPQDYGTAVKWYRLAAEQGHVDAQNYLGAMYEKGKGVPQDDKLAMKWYKLAAEQGSIVAQNSLGWMYDFKEDYETAVKWYKLASEQGYALAQYNLGFIYDFKYEDFTTAVKWYKLASEQGVARAHKRLIELQKKTTNQKKAPLVTAKNSPVPSSNTQKELERLRKEIAQLVKEEKKKPELQLRLNMVISGLGYFVSKIGHIITNEHIVRKCKKISVGDNAQKQITMDVIERDSENDLALLKVSSLKRALVETKYLAQKLGIKVTPLASGGLLRSEDLDLSEDVLLAQLSKSKFIKQSGSIPVNVNLGIQVSKVRQFLSASGLSTKWSKRSKNISSRDLSKIATKQTVMVICHQ